MSMPLLTVVSLGYRHPGGGWALQGVDLSIRRGRRLVLLGPNGAGKTTLLLHLNGILRPTTGAVLLDGAAVRYDRRGLAAWRTRVGLVLQDPDDQLFSAQVFQDVSFGPLNLGLPAEQVTQRVGAALEAMEIGELAARPTHQLSFGQKKRVAIAGLLALRPAVLVLDEPTAGLDPAGVEQLLSTLARLQEEGTTLVLTTHDVDLALAWADDAAVLAGGRLLAAGPVDEVLGDRDLLARSRLRAPHAVELWQGLRAAGRWHGQQAPRTVADLLAGLTA